jgi:hypothetical protein
VTEVNPSAGENIVASGEGAAPSPLDPAPPAAGHAPVHLESGPLADPPVLDSVSVARVATRVEVATVELVSASFSRADNGPLPKIAPPNQEPELGRNIVWELQDQRLGCRVEFGTIFKGVQDPPYTVFAGFRVTYRVAPGDPLNKEDIDQFAHWNAVFNVWPYWREFLASMVSRGQLPPFLAPVMRLPLSSPKSE